MRAKRDSKTRVKGKGLRDLRARGVGAKKAKGVKAGGVNVSELTVMKLTDRTTPR